MEVVVIKEHNEIPEGSHIYVDKELKKHYVGIWTSMVGSYKVKLKKSCCEIKK